MFGRRTMLDGWAGYSLSKWLFERALAVVYLIAFVCAVNQFLPLLGERGLLPASRFVRAVPFRFSPSLFYLAPTDVAFRAAGWTGIALSCVALSGLLESAAASAAVWGALWILYLSFVNVGQVFYGFGWESLLLEAGFFAMFLGGRNTMPSVIVIAIYRWVLFRDMFGAGLIKLRGDPCWRDLTCLDYYFETQPIPNGLSWFFHRLPPALHRSGVAVNHLVELAVPFLYFLPQPWAGVGGVLTIVFQLTLIVSGNLSWLNWLTIVLCIPVLDDRWWSWLPVAVPAPQAAPRPLTVATYAVGAIVIVLSVKPLVNLLSTGQLMNYSFNPLHLVNTYGAFGSITRTRYEIVIEGTDGNAGAPGVLWRAYEFKGKPGDPSRRPPQIAPYHLRLDWLMWFAAMSEPDEHPWFAPLLQKLLEGDRATIGLLDTNPFADRPPRFVRALYYSYRFTTPDERRRTGQWWSRELLGLYYPPVSLRTREPAPDQPR
jgi:hypothetical protein